jgi:hypothetical protein
MLCAAAALLCAATASPTTCDPVPPSAALTLKLQEQHSGTPFGCSASSVHVPVPPAETYVRYSDTANTTCAYMDRAAINNSEPHAAVNSAGCTAGCTDCTGSVNLRSELRPSAPAFRAIFRYIDSATAALFRTNTSFHATGVDPLPPSTVGRLLARVVDGTIISQGTKNAQTLHASPRSQRDLDNTVSAQAILQFLVILRYFLTDIACDYSAPTPRRGSIRSPQNFA